MKTFAILILAGVLAGLLYSTNDADELMQEPVAVQQAPALDPNAVKFEINPPTLRLGESRKVKDGIELTIWTNQKAVQFGGKVFQLEREGEYKFFLPSDTRKPPSLL